MEYFFKRDFSDKFSMFYVCFSVSFLEILQLDSADVVNKTTNESSRIANVDLINAVLSDVELNNSNEPAQDTPGYLVTN